MTNSRIPKSIRLCGIDYDITVENPNVNKELQKYEGYIDFGKKKIRISKKSGDKMFILYHELMHGAIEAITHKDDDMINNEDFMRPFSRIMYGISRELFKSPSVKRKKRR